MNPTVFFYVIKEMTIQGNDKSKWVLEKNKLHQATRELFNTLLENYPDNLLNITPKIIPSEVQSMLTRGLLYD